MSKSKQMEIFKLIFWNSLAELNKKIWFILKPNWFQLLPTASYLDIEGH